MTRQARIAELESGIKAISRELAGLRKNASVTQSISPTLTLGQVLAGGTWRH